ncbi:MAG: D-alanyl-D-alanine carboxypeptidase [Chloroflexia bacterium]|nr:D-alanyl-D-alanine carboxypeptidase [Chloroflexia bacterium]
MDVNRHNGGRRRSRPWASVSWWHSLILPAPFILLLLLLSLPPSDGHDGVVGPAPGAGFDSPVSIVTPTASVASPEASEHSPPVITARVALAVDLTSGAALFEREAHTQVAPASTMKIVTALVAGDILDLEEEVSIEPSDLILADDYSKMGLELGDVVTVDALLHGTLLSSGGDSALALARVSGLRLDPSTQDPVGRFVDEMNAYAAHHGMSGSHFSNPVGIDSVDHYVTAWDMLRATQRLLADPILAEIAAMPDAIVPIDGSNPRDLYLVSTNQFVLDGESFGVKTGSTDNAGECLLNATWIGDHRVVTIIMGSVDRYADTQTLLDFIG